MGYHRGFRRWNPSNETKVSLLYGVMASAADQFAGERMIHLLAATGISGLSATSTRDLRIIVALLPVLAASHASYRRRNENEGRVGARARGSNFGKQVRSRRSVHT